MKSFGSPISPTQRVDVKRSFDWDEMKTLLHGHVINQEPFEPNAVWDGNVQLSVELETGKVLATVYAWKREKASDEQPGEG